MLKIYNFKNFYRLKAKKISPQTTLIPLQNVKIAILL